MNNLSKKLEMSKERVNIDGVPVYCVYDKILKISELKPNPQNPNTHPQEQIRLLSEIILKTGWRATITISKRSGYIVKGHGRLEAARLAKFSSVPVEYQDFNSEDEEIAALIADNKIAEFSELDKKIIGDLFKDFDFSQYGNITGFSQNEYDEITNAFESLEECSDLDTEVELDKENITTQIGDIWQLGKHRLICGDSTNAETYEKLLEKEIVSMVLTDPPYNVDYEGKTKDHLKIQNDKKSNDDFYNFLLSCFSAMVLFLKDGGSVYCWHADSERVNFQKALENSGFLIKQNIIWNKNSMVMGRGWQDYHWKHEPCLYGWKEGASHYFVDDRTQTTVWEYNKPTRNSIHPTMKPVDLFIRCIENSSKEGQIVLDAFGGSGTTIVACEKTGRIGRSIELEPMFCDSIVKRYLTIFKDAKAVLIRNGKEVKHSLSGLNNGK